jgi:hypothetical protein
MVAVQHKAIRMVVIEDARRRLLDISLFSREDLIMNFDCYQAWVSLHVECVLFGGLYTHDAYSLAYMTVCRGDVRLEMLAAEQT